MGRLIPFHAIPDSSILPEGVFRMVVTKAEEAETQESHKLMFRFTSKVVEPAAYKGATFYDNFVIGTDDDPDAEQLETWQTSIGGRTFKQFVSSLGLALGDEEDSEALLAQMLNQQYLATIVQKVDDGSRDPRFKGRVRNVATRYWKLGEREPEVANGSAASPKKAAEKKVATPAKPAPSDEVTCTSCRKRVPRKDLRAHVEAHLKEAEEEEVEAE
jgi:hypothetical protein